MLDLFKQKTAIILSSAIIFYGWVILGLDASWGSDYYTLSPLSVRAVLLSPALLVLTSAWVAPEWRVFFPRYALHGVLLGAVAVGVVMAIEEGDMLMGLIAILMSMTLFGIVPYIVVLVAVTVGVVLGKCLHRIVRPTDLN